MSWARALLLAAGAGLTTSLVLGWDGGVRDVLDDDELLAARRAGLLRAFDVEPSTPLELLVPFGLALIGVVVLLLAVGLRGMAGRAERVVVAGALACVASLLLRALLDDTPGIPGGSALATVALLVALAAVQRLPWPERERPPDRAALLLGLVSAALLTGMVHDAYAVVDLDDGVFGASGVDEGTGWPQTWLGAPVGARTLVDAALILVATCGLVAALIAIRSTLERGTAAGLVSVAAVTFLGLLVLATGPNPGVGGVDRFPAALGPLLALLVLAPAALAASGREPVVPDAEPDLPPPPPEPEPPPERIAPPEAWAHPSERARGWWS